MKDKLYRMMNWPLIEGIVYAEEKNPEKALGCRSVSGGMLFQMFSPGAVKVSISFENEEKMYPMEMADEEGFFAAFIPVKEKKKYYYHITEQTGTVKKIMDPYDYPVEISKERAKLINAGLDYEVYQFLGAHYTKNRDVWGMQFCVWAPNAVRVSVVGDFNDWNGKTHPMSFSEETGIFTLFIPQVKEGMNYKYEIKLKGGQNVLKADPYAFSSEYTQNLASITTKTPTINWADKEWMKKREKINTKKDPISIYECNLLTYRNEDGSFMNYTQIGELLIPYLKKMQYTHVEFMPVMEYVDEATNGYQTMGYYAPTSRFGTAEQLMELINTLHQQELGVILDWVPSYFPKDEQGMALFDGTYLYGHLDERQRENMEYHGYQYNYARPQVSNLLIANAVYWVSQFHVDGLRFSGITSMLYLDYGKRDGEWVANIYGGNENLDAIEFLKHVNSILHKRYKGVITIAKETSAWPKITEKVESDGLGFDYVWDVGFVQDYLSYVQKEAGERIHCLKELTLSMVYAYSENYIISLSHNEAEERNGSICQSMSGSDKEKEAIMRATYVYMMCHPGKKMIYMGQDCSNLELLSAERGVIDCQINEKKYQASTGLYGAMNQLYLTLPALHLLDNEARGFEWIQCIDHSDGVVSFIRKGEYIEETLLVVANFSTEKYEAYKLGVPYEGKYKEIINSNQKEFGGDISSQTRLKVTKEEEYNGRINSLTVSLSPLSVSIYSYCPYTQEELLDIAEKKAQKIREKLEREAIKKAKALKKLSLREELETKVNAAQSAISTGKEVEKEIKVIKKKK